jgi:hypothetical protein
MYESIVPQIEALESIHSISDFRLGGHGFRSWRLAVLIKNVRSFP